MKRGLLVAVVLSACGRDAPYHYTYDTARFDAGAPDAGRADAGVDAGVDAGFDAGPRLDAGSPLCGNAVVLRPEEVAMRMLEVGPITRSSPSCFVDLLVAEGQNGLVRYARDGGGGATAHFSSDANFIGEIRGGVVAVCSGTVFDWSDGCRWASAQKIQGALSGGTLSFTYEERPIAGVGCLTPCSASGTIFVQ